MNSTLILPVAIMMGSSLAMKSYFKSWLAPGAFFSGIWTFFVIMPIIFAPSYPIYSFGLWVIVINMFAVGVGAMFGSQFSLASISGKQDREIDVFRSMVLITHIFILMSFIGVIFLFFFGVSRFSLTNSLLDFLILPNQFSMDRYHGAVVIPPAVRTMMYLVYPASLMGGITFDSINSKWGRSLLLLPILVAVFYAFLLTTRSTILLSMILWFSGWLTMNFYWIKVKKQKNRFKSIILSIIAMIVFTGIFVITAWLRDAGGELFLDSVVENVSAYFFGYLSSFTQWIQMHHQNGMTFGLVTFAGPADLLGLTERDLGFYNEISILGTAHTNIFTALRGIIHDFTIIGGFLFFGVMGLIASVATKEIQSKNYLWIVPLSAFYAFTLYSPLISIFNYNSILFSWVIMAIIMISTPMIKRIIH